MRQQKINNTYTLQIPVLHHIRAVYIYILTYTSNNCTHAIYIYAIHTMMYNNHLYPPTD